MKILGILIAVLSVPAWGQHGAATPEVSVNEPDASILEVDTRQEALQNASNPLLLSAIKSLHSCAAMPFVPAPTSRTIIPSRYVPGSNGPSSASQAAAGRAYAMFENRVTAGMNQYLATGSQAEAGCALSQLDDWAQANALLDYGRQESADAWYQVEWTLCAAGIADSILINEWTLDPDRQQRVTAWLDAAARKLISFERPGDSENDHHYWRALAATAIGITAADDKLFRFGIDAYKEAINQMDHEGALPDARERRGNAVEYQDMALQPLLEIAQFAERQGIDLYGYQAHGHTIRDAIVFFGHGADNQAGNFKPADFAAVNFYIARYGTAGLPGSILRVLQQPATSARIGGNTNILATK